MKLYVANCSKQVMDFIYRVPGKRQLARQLIDVGRQIVLAHDLDTPQITRIVDQHAKYGFVDVKEISRTKPFIGLCYSVDKPVDIGALTTAIQHNSDVLDEWGRQLRAEAAVAAANLANSNVPGLQALDVSIAEQPRNDGKPIELGEQQILVDRNASPAKMHTGPLHRRPQVRRPGGVPLS